MNADNRVSLEDQDVWQGRVTPRCKPTRPFSHPRTAPNAPMPPGPAVTELTNGSDGCWKVLADGERGSISDEEWRQELTRLITRRPAPK